MMWITGLEQVGAAHGAAHEVRPVLVATGPLQINVAFEELLPRALQEIQPQPQQGLGAS